MPYYRFSLLLSGVLLLLVHTVPAQPVRLTVDSIMQDPNTWIGDWPDNPFWSEDGDYLYFYWNPKGRFPSDSLFRVSREGGTPEQVPLQEQPYLPPRFTGWHFGEHIYDRNLERKVFERDGELFIYHRREKRLQRLTRTRERERNPRFTPDGSGVVFIRGNNLFLLDLATEEVRQLTDIRSGSPPTEKPRDPQQVFLEKQQEYLFEVIRKRKKREKLRQEFQRKWDKAMGYPPTFYTGKKRIQELRLDPTGRFVTFRLSEQPPPRPTRVQAYVTETGYTDILTARPKVGSPRPRYSFYIQDLVRDTTYSVDLYQLPGAYDIPEFLQEKGMKVDSSRTRRMLVPYGPFWSGDGRYAVMVIRVDDNKDRWIVRLDPETGTLTVLDRQHDEAWINGPGIGWWGGPGDVGWLPDNRHFWFQSERTGFSHLYTVDVETGAIQQLTDGDFEVFNPMISRNGRYWYFTSSEGSPFERHFYRMPIRGGMRTRWTTMIGNNQVVLSPDERLMGVRFSYTNQPWEIYLQRPRREAQRITFSPTEAWMAYPWREGEIITFEASDGVRVPAQIFVPERPNGRAVFFVHGAGYLQNVHRWWSSYFREYMFHNLLADEGYVVMNVDYRGSAGYGRDWRTAIYRHMGGRDLQDYVDASRYVQERFGIPPERVYIYGGSYGGFLTLMALFTAPEHFGGGAALRAVTDWAHYNHPYTSNILNTPQEDSLAYVRSSPIYHVEGLQDPLLMCHGIVDTNVQFQDIVRLTQRLIELGKDNWELAVYPVEGHGFVEPSSWRDEYRRIHRWIHQAVGPPEE